MKKIALILIVLVSGALQAMEGGEPMEREIAQKEGATKPEAVILLENIAVLPIVGILAEVINKIPLRERMEALTILLTDIKKSKDANKDHPLSGQEQELKRLLKQANKESKEMGEELWVLLRELKATEKNEQLEKKALELISAGAEVNLSGEGKTSRAPLWMAAFAGSYELIKALLDAGANPNFQDNKGQTALHWAAQTGSSGAIQGIQLLIDAGADLNIQDKNGDTPLHKSYEIGVVKALLKAGAETSIKNGDGETPLDVAKERGFVEIIEALGGEVS